MLWLYDWLGRVERGRDIWKRKKSRSYSDANKKLANCEFLFTNTMKMFKNVFESGLDTKKTKNAQICKTNF